MSRPGKGWRGASAASVASSGLAAARTERTDLRATLPETGVESVPRLVQDLHPSDLEAKVWTASEDTPRIFGTDGITAPRPT